MRPAVSAILLGLLLPFAACKSNQQATTGASSPTPSAPHAGGPTGASFDYFLLNLSWSPEFCYSHPDAAECASRATFVLHGLWPQNNDGSYPQNCSNAPGPSDPSAFGDIYPEAGLLEHEWHTHGTCSGLTADSFFHAARSAVHAITIPPELANLSSQTSMPPDEIVALFTRANPRLSPDSLVISCGHNFLTAVEICLDKSLHPIACGPIRSCRANTVRIPPPR